MTAKKPFELTIDRKKWLRGEGHGQSYLLRPGDRKQCCIGLYLTALHIPDDHLQGKSEPGQLQSLPGVSWWLMNNDGSCNSDTCFDLFHLNDDKLLSEKEREKGVKQLFAKHGIQVRFVGRVRQ